MLVVALLLLEPGGAWPQLDGLMGRIFGFGGKGGGPFWLSASLLLLLLVLVPVLLLLVLLELPLLVLAVR